MTHKISKTTELLRKYLMIDTTAPPGDVSKAIIFFREICDRSGIGYSIHGPNETKRSFLAKVPGTGEKRPVILINHIDVVPADVKKWSVPPFGGIIKDGCLYGRGAIDMKTMAIMELTALINLTQLDLKSCRDFYFLAVPDEEIGGKLGAQWVADNVPELLEAEAVINEAWPFVKNENDELDQINIAISEKLHVPVKLRATGTPGHASIPSNDNPNLKIARAVNRIIEWPMDSIIHISPLIVEYFRTLAHVIDPEQADKYRNLEESLKDPAFREKFWENSIHMAMATNTKNLTVLKGGQKENVIPAESEAIFNFRLLPGHDPDEFLAEMKEVINDESIEITTMHEITWGPDSSTDTDVYQAIVKVCNERFPGVPTAASMPVFTTDSRFFRAKGINSYGFQPILLSMEEVRGVHGIDERIPLESIDIGTEIMKRLVIELATG